MTDSQPSPIPSITPAIITPEKEAAIDKATAPKGIPRGMGRSTVKGGKIIRSPYRDEVATMILLGRGVREVCKFLEGKGLKVDETTIRWFRAGYVATLDQEIKDKLVEASRRREQEERERIVATIAHHRLTPVESTISLLEECEGQLAALKTKSQTLFTSQQVLRYVDQIQKLRVHLAELNSDSEIELARDKAISDITEMVLQILKDAPEKANLFIEKITQYKFRSTQYEAAPAEPK